MRMRVVLCSQAHSKGQSDNSGRNAGIPSHSREHKDPVKREISRGFREDEGEIHAGGRRSRNAEDQGQLEEHQQCRVSRWTGKESSHGETTKHRRKWTQRRYDAPNLLESIEQQPIHKSLWLIPIPNTWLCYQFLPSFGFAVTGKATNKT